MKNIFVSILLISATSLAFAERGVITHLDPELKSVTIVENAGEPRIYFVSDRERLRLQERIDLSQLQPGNEADFAYQATNNGRLLTRLEVENPGIVKEMVPYSIREAKSLSGEIVGKRESEMALTLLQDDRTRRTLRVQETAAFNCQLLSIACTDWSCCWIGRVCH